ncbi:hypothetical protein ABH931_003970 [Streptacidiphilus sp. MAP12-33]
MTYLARIHRSTAHAAPVTVSARPPVAFVGVLRSRRLPHDVPPLRKVLPWLVLIAPLTNAPPHAPRAAPDPAPKAPAPASAQGTRTARRTRTHLRIPRHRASSRARPNTAPVLPVDSFDQLDVPDALLGALTRNGVISPFPIQAATLPDALAGRDVLGRGRTDSGKTLAFGLAVLARTTGRRARPRRPLALVLVPTRELARQVTEALTPYADAVRLRMATVVGGMSINPQARELTRGAEVVVATPGRLKDLTFREPEPLEQHLRPPWPRPAQRRHPPQRGGATTRRPRRIAGPPALDRDGQHTPPSRSHRPRGSGDPSPGPRATARRSPPFPSPSTPPPRRPPRSATS